MSQGLQLPPLPRRSAPRRSLLLQQAGSAAVEGSSARAPHYLQPHLALAVILLPCVSYLLVLPLALFCRLLFKLFPSLLSIFPL